MNTQFKKGIIELCVLRKVVSKNMYGYEVVKEISKHIDVNENTIYPILRRLTKEGNFETYTEESEGGQKRKYYKVTKSGEEKCELLLNEWKDFISKVKLVLDEEDICE